MNTLYFKYAVEVEKAASITRAAENMYMAQPNLSKAIKELEETLGYTIFDRTKRGMVPTEKGADFLTYARRIVEQLNEMEMLSQNGGNCEQNFKVSIPRGSYVASGFTSFLAELDQKEEMDLTISETNSMEAIGDVVDSKCNIGVIRYQNIYENYFLEYLKNKGLKYRKIWEFEYVLVMSEQNPLAKLKNITPEDLEKYIEIAHGDTEIPYISNRTATGDKKQGKKILVYDRGSQFDILTNIQNSYMWVSPIPESYLEKYGLVQRACNVEHNKYKDVLIYREGYKFSDFDLLFEEKLNESKEEVSSKPYLWRTV